jgi:glycosyltransferase involved in cell wall biosynthesis
VYICVAAHLPPPINGCSTINAHIVQALADRTVAEVVDLAPPPAATALTKYAVRLFKALKAIRTLLLPRRAPRRVLYMQIDGGDGILLNVLIAIAARLRGFSAYLHHHSFAYINRRSQLMYALIRLAPKHSRHVVLCEDMGAQLRQAYKSAWHRSHARLLVVSNALLPVPTAAARATDTGPLTLCHLSNLTAAKGAIVFVELFERLRAAGIRVRAKVGGATAEPAVEAALKRALGEHPADFEWVGAVYGPAKAELLGASDLFVFPTAYANEAQPVVLLEALAAGLPIVTIRRGCIGCDFDARAGLIVDNAESFPQEAFDWVCAVARDPERLRRHRASALSIAAAKHGEAISGLERLLSELTRG